MINHVNEFNESLGAYSAEEINQGVIDGEINPIYLKRKNGVWSIW